VNWKGITPVSEVIIEGGVPSFKALCLNVACIDYNFPRPRGAAIMAVPHFERLEVMSCRYNPFTLTYLQEKAQQYPHLTLV